MAKPTSWYLQFATYFGAHHLPDSREQEKERAWQRGTVCFGLIFVWVLEHLDHDPEAPHQSLIALLFLYGVASYAYWYRLRSSALTPLLYVFLVVDSFLVVYVLVEDPQRFAFVYPFLLIVVVRCGLRYGLRTMYLSWAVALCSTPLLFTSGYWNTHQQSALAFIVLLASIPILFGSLVSGIHEVRRIELERARLEAMREVAVARSTFLSKVSHELRSPLQGIVSALDLMEMRHGSLQSEDRELVSRMRRSSLLLNTQLRDLLTLARGEAGRLELHPEPFEAGSLIEALVDSARELAADKNLELMAVLPDQPIFVVADCARIDQVLTNLVINSIRYTDEGQVRVKLLGYDPELRRLRFDVADTGPGIPDDALPSLLAPDRTLSSDERRGKGSGLGLAIVRTLVDLLGGEISVKSELGKGTTFTLAIPAEPVLSSDAEAPAEQRTNRVLVVDDREDVLNAISSVIDELGFDCDRASSAVVAANLLAARRYDTVLLDLDMPIKSGIEIAGEARRSQGPNARSRFIGMSASEARRGAAEPFDAILTKPLDQAALRQAVTAGNYLSRPSQPGLWSPDD